MTAPWRAAALPTPPFMPRMPRPANILPTVAPAPAPTLPSPTGPAVAARQARTASSGPTRMRPSPIARSSIARAHHDRHAHVRHAPVVADLLLLEMPDDARRRAEPHRPAAGEQDAVNLVERAHRLEHDPERFGRRRAVVIGAGRRRLVEQDRGAAGRPAPIREMAHADAADIGEGPGGLQRCGLACPGSRARGARCDRRRADAAEKAAAGDSGGRHAPHVTTAVPVAAVGARRWALPPASRGLKAPRHIDKAGARTTRSLVRHPSRRTASRSSGYPACPDRIPDIPGPTGPRIPDPGSPDPGSRMRSRIADPIRPSPPAPAPHARASVRLPGRAMNGYTPAHSGRAHVAAQLPGTLDGRPYL